MDLTQRLAGKRVAAVLSNGHLLQLRTDDGSEITIAWCDDAGRPLKGQPVAVQGGVRLLARGMGSLLHFPRIATHGEA